MCESGQWSHICSIITCIQLMEMLWLIISYTLKVISQPCLCCTNLFNYVACCLLLAFKMLSMFGSVPVNSANRPHHHCCAAWQTFNGFILSLLTWACGWRVRPVSFTSYINYIKLHRHVKSKITHVLYIQNECVHSCNESRRITVIHAISSLDWWQLAVVRTLYKQIRAPCCC